MRAIWKGAISFGLVSVPVKVFSATKSHDLPMHQVHNKDGGRIRYQRRCEECGEVVDFDDIDKAYDEGDQRVILTDEDFELLPAERSHEIEVVAFVPADQVEILRLDKSYYLEPEDRALKQYALLRETLADTERTAIARFALRQKTRLAAMRVRDDVLVLQTLLWDDEVRKPAFDVLENEAKISKHELAMAAQLVDSMSGDFDTSTFTDEYQEQLRELIEAKLKKGKSVDVSDISGGKDEDSGAEVIDLMEALRRSISAQNDGEAKPKKKATTKSAAKKSSKKPAKKTAAKKAAPKKSAAKKPAAKKSPAKKTRKSA